MEVLLVLGVLNVISEDPGVTAEVLGAVLAVEQRAAVGLMQHLRREIVSAATALCYIFISAQLRAV